MQPYMEPVHIHRPEELLLVGEQMRAACRLYPAANPSTGYSVSPEQATERAQTEDQIKAEGMRQIERGLCRVMVLHLAQGKVLVSATMSLDEWREPPRFTLSFGQVLPGCNFAKLPASLAAQVAGALLGDGFKEVPGEGGLKDVLNFYAKEAL